MKGTRRKNPEVDLRSYARRLAHEMGFLPATDPKWTAQVVNAFLSALETGYARGRLLKPAPSLHGDRPNIPDPLTGRDWLRIATYGYEAGKATTIEHGYAGTKTNPKKPALLPVGAFVWDRFRKWTAQIVRARRAKDPEDGTTYAEYTLATPANKQLLLGPTYKADAVHLSLAPAKALGQPEHRRQHAAATARSNPMSSYRGVPFHCSAGVYRAYLPTGTKVFGAKAGGRKAMQAHIDQLASRMSNPAVALRVPTRVIRSPAAHGYASIGKQLGATLVRDLAYWSAGQGATAKLWPVIKAAKQPRKLSPEEAQSMGAFRAVELVYDGFIRPHVTSDAQDFVRSEVDHYFGLGGW